VPEGEPLNWRHDLITMERSAPDFQGAEPHTKGSRAMNNVRFIGLDVHAETIAVAVAEPGGQSRRVGISYLCCQPVTAYCSTLVEQSARMDGDAAAGSTLPLA
jgi:hypothetical protein